jgi:copper ion binding protein
MCKNCGCHGGKMEQQVLTVEGMTCNHCKNAVEKAVRGLPGVMTAEVDLAAKSLKVEYDAAQSTINDIKKAVDDAGYKVV